MPTYVQVFDLWWGQTLKKQITVAVLKAAYDILNESVETPNHAARVAWATRTLDDPHLAALNLSAGVVMNPTVQSGVYTDSDVQYVVNSIVSVYAATAQSGV